VSKLQKETWREAFRRSQIFLFQTREFQILRRISENLFLVAYRGTQAIVKYSETSEIDEITLKMDSMRKIRNQNLVEIYSVVSRRAHWRLLIVMEYCNTGSLLQYVESDVKMDWNQFFQFSIDIISGLEYLHSKQITHLVINLHNILRTSDNRLKLTNYWSFVYFDKVKNQSHSSTLSKIFEENVRYIDPDLAYEGQIRPSVDIYAFAIVLYELGNRVLTGTYSKAYSDVFQAVPLLNYTRANYRPKFHPDFPVGIKSLVSSCWDVPDNRPTATQVLRELKQLWNTWEADTSETHHCQNLDGSSK